ncbi:MAG: hypothetical protein N3A62_10115 [Thermodesulfovibrionales bacterium]|nr:hypothetical protein [Thermodesulfovibrionales bacterium]
MSFEQLITLYPFIIRGGFNIINLCKQKRDLASVMKRQRDIRYITQLDSKKIRGIST